MTGRVAAVDWGRRRIGLAVCDPLGIAVRGLETLDLGPGGAAPEAAAARAAAVLSAEGVERAVVGLPLHADGRESESSREARAFGAALSEALGKPVEFHDEGLSSWAAEEDARAAGRARGAARRAGDADRGAAVAILRSWLQEREASRGAGGDAPG